MSLIRSTVRALRGSSTRRTTWRVRLMVAAAGLCGLSVISPATLAGEEDEPSSRTATHPADDADQQFWKTELKPFLKNFCYDCHSGEGAEADIDFTKAVSVEALGQQRPRWNQIRGMIEIGAMPPPDYDPLPTMEQREQIADWIDRKVNRVDCGVVSDPGRVTVRRLNSVEYDNSLRDLLGIDFRVSSEIGFPSDGVGNGFDNQGDVLTLSPIQLEKYLQAAQLVTSKIIVLDRESLREQRVSGEALFVTERTSTKFLFADGTYEVRVRMEFGKKKNEKVPVALFVDEQEIQRWEVGERKETFVLEHDFHAGEHELTIHFVEDPHSDRREDTQRRLEIDYVAVKGPEDGEPALPEPHRRLFAAMPSDNKSIEAAATEIFTPLVRRAFRREPKPIDVKRVVDLVTMATREGESFEQAVGYGLQSLLVSPHFLFRIENEAAENRHNRIESLGDYALASRLSYFLWASMPDDELLDLARDGQLSSPQVLSSQIKRMLADKRSEALVSRFFGQFLGLGNLKEATPDPKRFPLWNDRLRDAMRRETELFCQEIIDKDLPLEVLLLGDFTYVNPRLADLYGIKFDGKDPEKLYLDGPGLPRRRRGKQRAGQYVDEDRWMRVSLPENRRGVLSQAAILTLTSNPTNTSPVKRGKWILESILGDPPPPAPPNVPSFEETQEEHGNLSLREQLEIHRANPSCASCHRVMDPLGLGFENFDAIGQWRDTDGKHAINAAGQLADGRQFNGSVELVELLQSRQREIFRHFAEQLLTYGLGRGLEPYDNCAVDDILAAAEDRQYRLSAFIQAIVTSEPFIKRTLSGTSDS